MPLIVIAMLAIGYFASSRSQVEANNYSEIAVWPSTPLNRTLTRLFGRSAPVPSRPLPVLRNPAGWPSTSRPTQPPAGLLN